METNPSSLCGQWEKELETALAGRPRVRVGPRIRLSRQRAAGQGKMIPFGPAQGAAQGAARTFMSRLTEKYMTDPPDWVETLWDIAKGLWE